MLPETVFTKNRKVNVMKKRYEDFRGFSWGWITEDGKRVDGDMSLAKYTDIVGIWGRVFRDGIVVGFYCETYLCEYVNPNTPDPTSCWTKHPLTMLQELNRQQTLRLAYHLAITEEVLPYPEVFGTNIEQRQEWKCGDCEHTFYTPVGQRAVWYKAVYRWVVRLVTNNPELIECTECHKVAAKKYRVRNFKI